MGTGRTTNDTVSEISPNKMTEETKDSLDQSRNYIEDKNLMCHYNSIII